jgi:hypothetical protein
MIKISGLTVALMAKKCIGHVHATGDAKHDMDAAMNLHEMCVTINVLLADIHDAMYFISSDTPGAHVLGGRAIGYLAELRDAIDGWLEEARDQQMQKRSDGDG